jgi:hypothetical protein
MKNDIYEFTMSLLHHLSKRFTAAHPTPTSSDVTMMLERMNKRNRTAMILSTLLNENGSGAGDGSE